MSLTAAHTQQVTLRIIEAFPAHEARKSDPHYRLFNESRKLLRDAGKLACWVCGSREGIELHHDEVEFALAEGIDVQAFALDHPQFNLSDRESFFRFVEGPGNLLPLCVDHHRGIHGIHSLTYPTWCCLKYQKAGDPAFGTAVRLDDRKAGPAAGLDDRKAH